MFISPKVAIEEGWITGIKDPEKQVQPNAIDFTVDRLFTIKEHNFVIDESHKRMSGGVEILAQDYSTLPIVPEGKFWRLDGQTPFDGMSDIYVDVPEGVAAMLVVRSTFNRNGIFIASGLYDSGFKGHIGFVVYNMAHVSAYVGKGTRIGQIVFVESNSVSVYSGGYNHKMGTHFSEK